MKTQINLRAALQCTLLLNGGRAVLEASADKGKIRRFKLLAYTGGKTYMPGFPIPVVFELATMRIAPGMPIPALLEHNNKDVVGHTEDVTIGESEITGTAIMSAATEARDTVVESADNGFQWQLSVGAVADRENLIEVFSDETRKINGQVLRGPFLLARDSELREITFTATGADAGGAVATLAASFGLTSGDRKMKFADYVKSLGFEIATLTAAQLAGLRSAWKTLPNAVEDTPEEKAAAEKLEADKRKAEAEAKAKADADKAAAEKAAAEAAAKSTTPADGGTQPGSGLTSFEQDTAAAVQRVESLTTLNASFNPRPIEVGGSQVPLLAHAITNRWDPTRFELECRRQARPEAPARQSGGSGGDREVLLASLVGGILHRLNVPVDHSCFTTREAPILLERKDQRGKITLSASLFTSGVNESRRQQWMNDSHRWRNHSIIDLMASAARLDGLNLDEFGHWREEAWMRAAFSSTAITDMFTQAVNARVLMSWTEQASRLLELVEETDVPNFMLNERKMLEMTGGAPRPLPNQGVAKDITLSANGETIRAKMYADRFQFSEQDAIDERFDTLKKAGSVMGERARRLIFDLVAYVLIGNPTMTNTRAFQNTTDGNLRTGKALTRDNLISGLTAFETQQENGVNVDVSATHLLVAKASRFAAAELIAPSKLITGSDTTRGDFNSIAGSIDNVIHDARIDNGFTDPTDTADVPATIAGVPTTWWLADRRQPAIEVAYVAGHGRAPRMRSGQLTNGQYGVWFDCSMAAGAAPVKRKSIQRNNAS